MKLEDQPCSQFLPELSFGHLMSVGDGEYERCMDILAGQVLPLHFVSNTAEHMEQEVSESSTQIIEFLQQRYDLRVTTMPELERAAVSWQQVDETSLSRIMKKLEGLKRTLKRQRARERTLQRIAPLTEVPKEESTAISSSSDEVFLTKQKNRMSAQLSRDRKKQRMQQLEAAEQSHQIEIERLKRQNEELRKRSTATPMLQLLAFLGLLFLLDLVKGLLGGERDRQRQASSNDAYRLSKNIESCLNQLPVSDTTVTQLVIGKLQRLTEKPMVLQQAKRNSFFAEAWQAVQQLH